MVALPGHHADHRGDCGCRRATAIVVLAGLAVEAPTGAVVAAGVVAFLVVWGALFFLQRLNLRVLRRGSTRFPTPPDEP